LKNNENNDQRGMAVFNERIFQNSVKEIIDKRKKIDSSAKQMNLPLLIGSHAVYAFRIFGITTFPAFNLHWLLHLAFGINAGFLYLSKSQLFVH
jgi:hypothetical protein